LPTNPVATMTEALLLALALAMDAFAVALTQGARFRPGVRGALAIALTFGLFQGVMPLIGWGIGAFALTYVEAVDHWIAFGLLAFLGVRMLGGHVGEEEAARALTGKAPLIAAALIGLVTFIMSGAGVALGRIAGDRWGEWAERAGGVILIALGCKILAEHMGYL
jgi:manganese efflux pump family protein